MKHKMIVAFALLPLFMAHAAQTFQLDFNDNNVKPVIAMGGKSIKPVALDPAQNFPEGFIGKGLRNNGAKPFALSYNAKKSFPFTKGTISFWCKTPAVKTGKNQRLVHIYAPKKGENSVLIYTFYINGQGEFVAQNELSATQSRTMVKVPSSEIKAGEFSKIDVTWDGKLLSIYKNGDLQQDADLPASYAAEAVAPRGWSSFFVLYSFKSLNDDPACGIIIDEIKCHDTALDSDAVRASYDADINAKGKK